MCFENPKTKKNVECLEMSSDGSLATVEKSDDDEKSWILCFWSSDFEFQFSVELNLEITKVLFSKSNSFVIAYSFPQKKIYCDKST